jgi:predicted 3-demethylubiquinone-9 3-methyltransferase (glyoxalase superfamily)
LNKGEQIMEKVTPSPFLMFQGDASDALGFYLGVFPDAQALNVERYDAGEAGIEGSIKRARFSIGGPEVICADSVVKHAFAFTPAFSLLTADLRSRWTSLPLY